MSTQSALLHLNSTQYSLWLQAGRPPAALLSESAAGDFDCEPLEQRRPPHRSQGSCVSYSGVKGHCDPYWQPTGDQLELFDVAAGKISI